MSPHLLMGLIGAIVGFVILILGFTVALRVITADENKRGLPPGFLKLYGLIILTGFALLLVVVPSDRDIKTAAFTLLGIIAGYLAGSPNIDRKEDKTIKTEPNNTKATKTQQDDAAGGG